MDSMVDNNFGIIMDSARLAGSEPVAKDYDFKVRPVRIPPYCFIHIIFDFTISPQYVPVVPFQRVVNSVHHNQRRAQTSRWKDFFASSVPNLDRNKPLTPLMAVPSAGKLTSSPSLDDVVKPFSDVFIDDFIKDAVGEIDQELTQLQVQKQVTIDCNEDGENRPDRCAESKARRNKRKGCKKRVKKAVSKEAEIAQDYLREEIPSLDCAELTDKKEEDAEIMLSAKAVKEIPFLDYFQI